jgi:ABC-type uncharacterized transport system substrate-binding protein
MQANGRLEIAERWIGQFERGRLRALTDLKKKRQGETDGRFTNCLRDLHPHDVGEAVAAAYLRMLICWLTSSSPRWISSMIKSLLRLWLAAFLILAASAALLLNDRERPRSGAGPSRTWKIGVAAFSESNILEEVIEGLRLGLKEAGLVEGKDGTLMYHNAQGDIATLSALFDELNGSEADVIVSLSTPALQAALRNVNRKPIVFGTVLDPFAAGAGKSDSDHRPNVTGVYLAFPYAEMARTIRKILPRARRVGTLFTPGEVNSVVARQRFEASLKGEGLALVSLPVNGPTEVSDAALGLCQSGIDVLCQLSDNLSNASFPAIARACEMAKMPLFTFSPGFVKWGAVLGVGSDYTENGREVGLVAVQVLRGEDPSRIPFHASAKTRRSVNLDNARRLGISVPADWLTTADEVVPGRPQP